jgi:hypothetical protein
MKGIVYPLLAIDGCGFFPNYLYIFILFLFSIFSILYKIGMYIYKMMSKEED